MRNRRTNQTDKNKSVNILSRINVRDTVENALLDLVVLYFNLEDWAVFNHDIDVNKIQTKKFTHEKRSRRDSSKL